MDSFSENLSKKYTESSIENPDHFKAGVIQKIVQRPKVDIIDMNETMKDEYKEFNKSDNVYYLYTITREQ